MFFLRWRRWTACPPGAPCTARCRTRACAATASVPPTPARAVPCWTKPCLATSCSAARRRTTARCPPAWSTTRPRPTCGVSRHQSAWKARQQRRSSSVAVGGHAAANSSHFTRCFSGTQATFSSQSGGKLKLAGRAGLFLDALGEPPLPDALGFSVLLSGSRQDADTCLKSHLSPTNIISTLQAGSSI